MIDWKAIRKWDQGRKNLAFLGYILLFILACLGFGQSENAAWGTLYFGILVLYVLALIVMADIEQRHS